MSDVKYLDLQGLQLYHNLNKTYIDNADEALDGRIDTLETAIGEGGSVATQIQSAIDELTGTLENSDAATIEAINDELDGIDSAIATLNGDNTTAGSVAKAVKDGIDAIGTGTAQGTSGQAIVSLTQTNGVVTATAGDIDASHVTVDFTPAQEGDDPVSATANVQASLNEIYGKIADNAEAGEVAVYSGANKVNSIAADGATYTLKQGTQTVATINIARDMVVSSGSVITADGTETDVPTGTTLTTGQKYVRLVIANSTDGKNIYIAVNDLYDDYTFTDGDEIDFTETNNEVTAVIKSASIAESKLNNALQQKINSARTVITEIAQTDPATKHILVTKTAGTGANPDSYTITEVDIASASALSAEVTRAQSAETAIDGAVGLTKGANDETRTWTPTTNYHASGNTHTVANNMAAIDAALKSLSDDFEQGAIASSDITSLFSGDLNSTEINAALSAAGYDQNNG